MNKDFYSKEVMTMDLKEMDYTGMSFKDVLYHNPKLEAKMEAENKVRADKTVKEVRAIVLTELEKVPFVERKEKFNTVWDNAVLTVMGGI